MSLINDALKRAKQAQQDTPLPELPGPQLRPVDPEAYVRRGFGLALPIALATVALLILFFVWQYSQRSAANSQKPVAGQQTTPASAPGAVRARAPETTVRSSGAESSKASAAQTPASDSHAVADGRSSLLPTNGPQLLAKVEPGAATAGTNTAVQPQPQPPKPSPPKLQGIVFDPRRPSAVINGRTLFVGDRFGEFRVRGISRDTVVLVGGGQTNILSLEE